MRVFGTIASYIVPVIFIVVLVLSFVKKRNAYNAFLDGSKSAINLVVGVFPYLLTIMVAIQIYRISGVSNTIANFIAPAMNLIGIPAELSELILIRPFSGSAALGLLENIFATYGPDSQIGRAASVIYGSSETVFYIATIYFSQSKVKRLGPAIPFALIATFIGCIVGVQVLRVI